MIFWSIVVLSGTADLPEVIVFYSQTLKQSQWVKFSVKYKYQGPKYVVVVQLSMYILLLTKLDQVYCSTKAPN